MDESELNEIVNRAGGAGFDPYKKQRKEAEKLRKANDIGSSPFVILPAKAEQTSKQPQQPLYGDFWRTGELAVLIGESGVGKSLLATQIAEVIARGDQNSINGLPTASEPRRIIYFDLGRKSEQFSRIYSCQPFDDEPDYRQEYSFSTNFELARLEIVTDIPESFKGSVDRYIRFWVCDAIGEDDADVVIIDSIEHLAIGTTYEKLMRSLRTVASVSGASLLVVARSKPKRRPSAVTLADVAHRQVIIDEADSVFTISRSITHPDIRYVKDLKARTTQLTADLPAALQSLVSDQSLTTDHQPLTTASAAVLTYKIERLLSPIKFDDTIGNSQSTALQTSPHSPLSTVHYPFLGLRYLTLSLESQHLPQIRTPKSQTPNRAPRQLKPTSRAGTAEMLMSKEYRRYLDG